MSRLIDANETLKKLKHYGFTSPDMTVADIRFNVAHCPNCKYVFGQLNDIDYFGINIDYQYCNNCGQKIDWEVE